MLIADPFEVLRTPAPAFSIQRAAELLRENYDLRAELAPLVSERDQNFLVTITDGARYVLKFANSAERPEVTDFQVQALRHIARVAPEIPVPAVVPTRDDLLMFEAMSDTGTSHQVRLLSWLDGKPLYDAKGVSSIAGQMGHAIEPAIEPLGFDWKIGVGLIASLAAREVIVATLAQIYAASDEGTSLRAAVQNDVDPETGQPIYTPATVASLLVFFVFALQCTSTIVVMARETGSWRWPALAFAYMLALAYTASFVTFQTARWIL